MREVRELETNVTVCDCRQTKPHFGSVLNFRQGGVWGFLKFSVFPIFQTMEPIIGSKNGMTFSSYVDLPGNRSSSSSSTTSSPTLSSTVKRAGGGGGGSIGELDEGGGAVPTPEQIVAFLTGMLQQCWTLHSFVYFCIFCRLWCCHFRL